MRETVLAESWLELGKRLLGDTLSNSIIGIDDDLLRLLGLGVGVGDLNISKCLDNKDCRLLELGQSPP